MQTGGQIDRDPYQIKQSKEEVNAGSSKALHDDSAHQLASDGAGIGCDRSVEGNSQRYLIRTNQPGKVLDCLHKYDPVCESLQKEGGGKHARSWRCAVPQEPKD